MTFSDTAFTETANILLWGSSIYIAAFQTLSMVLRRPLLKKFSEIALSLGSALIFILFYAYLDLRISLNTSFLQGEIDAETMAQALRIQSFPAVFENSYVRRSICSRCSASSPSIFCSWWRG